MNLRNDWSGIPAARLEKDIFVRTHLHTSQIVVRINLYFVMFSTSTKSTHQLMINQYTKVTSY